MSSRVSAIGCCDEKGDTVSTVFHSATLVEFRSLPACLSLSSLFLCPSSFPSLCCSETQCWLDQSGSTAAAACSVCVCVSLSVHTLMAVVSCSLQNGAMDGRGMEWEGEECEGVE